MLGPAGGQLLAWMVVAIVSAVPIAISDAPVRVRVWHLALSTGHALALGLFSYAAVRARERLVPRAPWRAVLLGAAIAIDGAILFEDVAPRAAKLAASAGGTAGAWAIVMAIGFGATVLGAAQLGVALRRGPFRAVALATAVIIAGANAIVLPRVYPGVHLHVAWVAAILLGAAWTGLSIPRPSAKRFGAFGLAAASVLAVASLAVKPPMTVRVHLLAHPGTVLAPYVARFHTWLGMAASAPAWRAEPAREHPPSEPRLLPSDAIVVLVVVDALRADLFASDAHAARLPNLHAMRRAGVWVEEARTTAPATIVAVTSLFSGRYFSELAWRTGFRIDEFPWPHTDETPRLPEVLSRHGVRTTVIHGVDWLAQDTGVAGRFDENVRLPPNERERALYYVESPRLVDATLERLAAGPAGPQFIYLHLLEGHAPYESGTDGAPPFERYLGDLALVDAQIGRLREALAAPSLAARSMLVVTADHGEAFAEHGASFHATTLYEEMIRVPLLFEARALQPRTVRGPVTLLDLAPTVLDLFGAPAPASFSHGATLVPLVARGEAVRERPLLCDSGRHQRALVFPDRLKIIEDRRYGTVELFDLDDDPGERKNLVDDLPGDASARLEALRSFFAAHEHATPGYTTPLRLP